MQDPSNLIETGGAPAGIPAGAPAAGRAGGNGANGTAVNGTGGAPPLSYARPAPRRFQRAVHSWARHTFARERIFNGLRNLLWVAPLTLLIWIYAEREQIHPQPDVAIPIEVTANDPNWVVTLQRPSDPTIIATLSGPKSQVDAAIQDIHNTDPRFGSGPIRIEVPKNLGPGAQRIDASRIGNDQRFVSRGVTVSNYQPAWLDVYMDPILTEEVEIKATEKPVNVGTVTFTPSVVKVRGPERVLHEARKAGRLVAEANLAGRPEVANMIANPSQRSVTLPDVKLSLPADLHSVSIVDAGAVKADVSLKPGKELTLQYVVQTEVQATPAIVDGYKINIDENSRTLPNVTVQGPENIIDQMSKEDFQPKPVATFEVTQDDITTDAPHTKQVEFKFPPGVTYKSGPNTVTFTVTHRPTGG